MEILIRRAKIIDPSSPFHLKQADLLINNGIINKIEEDLGNITADKIIEIPSLHISAGWLDVFSHFNDPGFEFKETLETGAAAAAKGGYTDVMILPNTAPALHNKSSIEYIVQKSKSLITNIHPIGAVTKNTEGKELAEMYDMHQSGAVSFSDGINTIQSSGIVLKALQYLKAINKTIIQLPDDKSISAAGLMNEGITSTQLGLPGNPSIAEELMISRDIELAKYTDSKIHFTGVSTKKSLEIIRQAKKDGIQVTCSVTPYHLYFKEYDLVDYDTNLKVNPPLRTEEDKTAILEAVIDGTVDCIATHHLPQDADNKVVEFENAKNGMIGLETCFAVLRTCLPKLSIEKIVELLSTNPKNIFAFPVYKIEKGQPACFTLFDVDKKWNVDRNSFGSRSINSPFIGRELVGKPLGIINKDRLFLNEF